MEPDTAQGFSEIIGLEFTDVDPGYSRGVVDVTDELKNPHGSVHGSVLHTMADTGMGIALYTELDENEQCATIEIKINYLQSVRSGQVICETSLLQKGRSIAYLESELTHGDEIIARATGTYSILTTEK
jgi:acyl-CoA thioesterase